MRVIKIKNKIKQFNKVLSIEGDKSLSIRWVLISSLSKKKSIAYNLLKSEDVMSSINCIKTLGSKVKFVQNKCEIIGSGFHIKKKGQIYLNAGNSGTLGRVILGLLINSKKKIKLIGDKSLSRRDFSRVIKPLKKFGAKFNVKKNIAYFVIMLPPLLNSLKSLEFTEHRLLFFCFGMILCLSNIKFLFNYNKF